MNGWTITKVWDIDGKLYVAPTIEDAIALYKLFVGDEPRDIKAVRGSSLGQYYYLGKATVLTDLLKLFEPLEG